MSAERIPYRFEPNVAYGAMQQLSPLVRRVVAHNPSVFTYTGTGTFIVGRGGVAVIDPGPDDRAHLAALVDGLRGETVEAILLTHSHPDHRPLARDFAAATGAPIYAYRPDAGEHALADGQSVKGTGWRLDAIHTPGHASDHLCFGFAAEDTIFTGDHVMGWSTTVIPPPDGDLGDYLRSLERIRRRPERLYRPTHGPEIPDGPDFAGSMIAYRLRREDLLIEQLRTRAQTTKELLSATYIGIDARLLGAAEATVRAHLGKLVAERRVVADGALWRLA